MQKRLIWLSFALTLVLAACAGPTLPPAPTAVPRATTEAGAPPAAVEYNLGETTITQARFPEDSRFRNMPMRLNGLVAVLDEGDLSQAAAISLRAAVDPLSEFNAKGKPQAFSIRVTDGAGMTATATARQSEGLHHGTKY
jgi:hypothetical protein